MKRFAFKMFLKPGCEKEYAKRHAASWPELKQMIKDAGVGSQDTDNVDPITQKWWDMMADIMEVNPDNSPVTIPIEEVFHLE